MKTDPSDGDVKKKFKSRKNKVFMVEYQGKERVVKEYREGSHEKLLVERNLLVGCEKRGIPVPKVMGSTGDTLVLEYIPGPDCKILFEQGHVHILPLMARWLADFHEAFAHGYRKGDCILGNFLYHDKVIYGIDFEESSQGDPLRDLGDMCVSILRMGPSFTPERFLQVNSFIGAYFECFSQQPVDLTDPVVEAMDHYSKFGSDGEELRKWGDRIKEVGSDSIFQNRKG